MDNDITTDESQVKPWDKRRKNSRLRVTDGPESSAAVDPSVPSTVAEAPPTLEEVSPPEYQGIPIHGTPYFIHDVVQITDGHSRHYGMFFSISAANVNKKQAHGYYVAEGVKKEFITTPLDKIVFIGHSPEKGAVRAGVYISPKWESDNR